MNCFSRETAKGADPLNFLNISRTTKLPMIVLLPELHNQSSKTNQ
jgi:hypothetical protein